MNKQYVHLDAPDSSHSDLHAQDGNEPPLKLNESWNNECETLFVYWILNYCLGADRLSDIKSRAHALMLHVDSLKLPQDPAKFERVRNYFQTSIQELSQEIDEASTNLSTAIGVRNELRYAIPVSLRKRISSENFREWAVGKYLAIEFSDTSECKNAGKLHSKQEKKPFSLRHDAKEEIDPDSTLSWRIGRVIRRLREHYSLSQKELAERACIAQPTLSQIENGERAGSINALKLIAMGLGVNLSNLIGFAEDPLGHFDIFVNSLADVADAKRIKK